MRDLEVQGFTAKEALNLCKENKKLEDLTYLKSQDIPGPFTTSEEITNFMDSCLDSKDKNKSLYIEVRYARKTSQSLKESASVFRLKVAGKNLSTDDYATNLVRYFDSAKSCSSLTLGDLTNVIVGLKGLSNTKDAATTGIEEGLTPPEPPSCSIISSSSSTSNFQNIELVSGEHIVAVWLNEEKNELQWYLGIVSDSIRSDINVKVSIEHHQIVEKAGSFQKNVKKLIPHSTTLFIMDFL